MKKIIVLLTFIILLTGCNKQLIDLEYDEFDKIICNYDGDKFELKVDKWKDYEGEQMQIKSGNKKYLVSMNHCYLVGDR